MTTTYKAFEVAAPDKLTETVRTLIEPEPGQVRLRVEACGVCHADSATVEGQFPGLTFPCVPGHEVVGRIDAVGPQAFPNQVSQWNIGQRVGFGFFGGVPSMPRLFCAGVTTFNALGARESDLADSWLFRASAVLVIWGFSSLARLGFHTVAT